MIVTVTAFEVSMSTTAMMLLLASSAILILHGILVALLSDTRCSSSLPLSVSLVVFGIGLLLTTAMLFGASAREVAKSKFNKGLHGTAGQFVVSGQPGSLRADLVDDAGKTNQRKADDNVR